MKKVRVFILLTCAFFLSACASNTIQQTETEVKSEVENSLLKDYISNPQVPDDRELLKVGETYRDEKGEITLKQINHLNETVDIGPIQLTFKEMKVIHLNPDYSLVDYFHVLTHEEEFDFVKVFVEIENTSSETVNFAPIATIETSQGEQIPWENDIYLDGLNGVFEGNEKKFGNLGFIIEKSDLSSLKITTSDVFSENEEKIADFQNIMLEF